MLLISYENLRNTEALSIVHLILGIPYYLLGYILHILKYCVSAVGFKSVHFTQPTTQLEIPIPEPSGIIDDIGTGEIDTRILIGIVLCYFFWYLFKEKNPRYDNKHVVLLFRDINIPTPRATGPSPTHSGVCVSRFIYDKNNPEGSFIEGLDLNRIEEVYGTVIIIFVYIDGSYYRGIRFTNDVQEIGTTIFVRISWLNNHYIYTNNIIPGTVSNVMLVTIPWSYRFNDGTTNIDVFADQDTMHRLHKGGWVD